MLNKVATFPLLILIRGYQLIISPLLGSNCRFMPTCSEYAMESLRSHGLIKGSYLTIKSCLLYTSPSPRDATLSRMPSSA